MDKFTVKPGLIQSPVSLRSREFIAEDVRAKDNPSDMAEPSERIVPAIARRLRELGLEPRHRAVLATTLRAKNSGFSINSWRARLDTLFSGRRLAFQTYAPDRQRISPVTLRYMR
jgi:hypothetical protein